MFCVNLFPLVWQHWAWWQVRAACGANQIKHYKLFGIPNFISPSSLTPSEVQNGIKHTASVPDIVFIWNTALHSRSFRFKQDFR